MPPPPPPPEGKKKKKKKSRPAKGQTKQKKVSAESPTNETKLEFSSDDSEDEDLANFIESLGASPSKKTPENMSDDDPGQGLIQDDSPVLLQKSTPRIPLVENVSSNASCASAEHTETPDTEANGLMAMLPVERHAPTVDSSWCQDTAFRV